MYRVVKLNKFLWPTDLQDNTSVLETVGIKLCAIYAPTFPLAKLRWLGAASMHTSGADCFIRCVSKLYHFPNLRLNATFFISNTKQMEPPFCILILSIHNTYIIIAQHTVIFLLKPPTAKSCFLFWTIAVSEHCSEMRWRATQCSLHWKSSKHNIFCIIAKFSLTVVQFAMRCYDKMIHWGVPSCILLKCCNFDKLCIDKLCWGALRTIWQYFAVTLP